MHSTTATSFARRTTATVLLLSLSACSSGPTSPSDPLPRPESDIPFISYVSEPGEFVGGGESRLITNTFIHAVHRSQDAEGREYVFVTAKVDGSQSLWGLLFASAVGRKLERGVYEHASMAPRPDEPKLRFDANDRGCSANSGRFEIKEAVYGSAGTVKRLHATFEQRCATVTAALHGEVRIVAPQ